MGEATTGFNAGVTDEHKGRSRTGAWGRSRSRFFAAVGQLGSESLSLEWSACKARMETHESEGANVPHTDREITGLIPSSQDCRWPRRPLHHDQSAKDSNLVQKVGEILQSKACTKTRSGTRFQIRFEEILVL